MNHLLSLLIFTPLITALIAMLVPSRYQHSFKVIALVVSLFQFVVLYLVLQSYSPEQSFQLEEKISWIHLDLGPSVGEFQSYYYVAVDGLSITLVSLAVIVLLIAVICSWTLQTNVKGYFILLLILNGAILGSFCALDLLLFYVFFEFMLLPMYFLIGIWGGRGREYASIKFFLYTLLGSILILVVLIALYVSTRDPLHPERLVHSFNMLQMTDPSNFISGSALDPAVTWWVGPYAARTWAFALLFIGFGIKLPVVPFHTWLPDAHVEAPTAISVILAALLLKIGAYGLLRLAYPIFPVEALNASWMVGLLGVVSIVYGALNALASNDLKRLIAYSSVSHMGFVLLGLASGTVEGTSGAVYQLFSHGVIASMLFALAGVLSDRTQDRTIGNYSGLASNMKAYTAFVMVAFFASMGLPGFSGFIGEVLILLGAFQSSSSNELLPRWMTVASALSLVLTAGYYLWTLQRMFFGPLAVKVTGVTLDDLRRREYIVLLPLATMALFFGIFPQPLLDFIHPFSTQFVQLILHHKP